MISPAIQFVRPLSIDRFRSIGRERRQTLPPTYAIEPCPPKIRFVEDPMDIGPPYELIIADCTVQTVLLIGARNGHTCPISSRVGDVEAGPCVSTPRDTHMNVVPANAEVGEAHKMKRFRFHLGGHFLTLKDRLDFQKPKPNG